MKRTHFLFVCSTVFVLLTVIACQKTYNKDNPSVQTPVNPATGPPNLTTKVSLNALFKDLRSTPETQCVTAGIDQTVVFNKGTRLTFYPNSFKDAAGNILTSGEVCLEMVEMYKPGDMIANRASTVTKEGDLLISGGQVHIKATMNGKEVFANKYGIAFPQPAASTQPMDLYYGDRSNSDSVVSWSIAPPGNGGTTTGTTPVDSLVSAYHFDSATRFSFINCDRLNSIPGDRTNNIRILMPDGSFDKNTTDVLFVFPTINTVTHAYYYYIKTKSFAVAPAYKIPLGLEISVVVIAKKDDNYYYYDQKGLTVSDGLSIAASPTKMSLDEIKAKLAEL